MYGIFIATAFGIVIHLVMQIQISVKKLYEYYLAQHTSGSNKKGWNSSDKSATNSFKSLEDNTNQDVFWSIFEPEQI